MSALTLRLQRRIERDFRIRVVRRRWRGWSQTPARLSASKPRSCSTPDKIGIDSLARSCSTSRAGVMCSSAPSWRTRTGGRCSTWSLVRRRRISRGRSPARAVPVLFVAVTSEHNGQLRSRDPGPPTVSHSRDDGAGSHTPEHIDLPLVAPDRYAHTWPPCWREVSGPALRVRGFRVGTG
jgi:hypothetical protein